MPETISSENTQNEPSNSSPIQKENEINSSQFSNPILNKIGRFHIHQPFRGAFGGLTSFLGRAGKGKNTNENGEKTIATELPEKKEKEEEKNKEINEENGEEAKEQIVRYNGEMVEEEEITNGKNNQNEIVEEEEEILQPIEILPNKANIEDEGKRKEKPNENGEKMASAPQPKPRRRLRRGSSVVHPSIGEALPITEGEAIAPAIRPRSLSARKLQRPLEPSKQSQWIYVQMPDRSFKRTTEAELQNRRQTIGGGNGQIDVDNLPEFASVKMAIGIQSTFHGISIILQGFLSGLAFGHAIFVWSLFPQKTMIEFYAPLAIPIQIFFYIFLSLAAVDAMDRYHLPIVPSIDQFIRQSFISSQFFVVFCWISAFLASISCAQVDEYLAQNDWEIIEKNNWLLLKIWCWSSSFRAIFCIIGWLMVAQNPSKNATGEELRKMIQIIRANQQNGEGKIPSKEVKEGNIQSNA